LKLNPDSLGRQLAERLLPVYLICGDEPLLAGEAADAVRAAARAAGFTEREVHFMDRGGDWDAVRSSVSTLSLFAARRSIEVRLPSGKPGVTGGRALVGIIESLQEDTLLLILTGRLDRDAQAAEWVRAAETRGAWVSVWPITAERLAPWLASRCRQLGLTADADALALLAERTQGNLLAAKQELDKLRLLLADRHITLQAVLASAADSARFDVAELREALASGAAARAVRILGGLRAEGVELPLALWAVVRALRELSESSDAAGGSGRGVRGARTRSVRRLTERALRADAMAKGRIAGDAWDELMLLAVDACGRPALPLAAAVIPN